MFRDICHILSAFLLGCLLLWATTAHACFYGSASVIYAPQVAVAQVAYVQAYAVAVPQVAYVAAAMPCAQVEAPVVPAQLPAAVYPSVLPAYSSYGLGVNALGYNSVGFNSFGFNSYGYGTNVFVGRRAFFRSDFGSGVNVNVFSGRRGFFAGRGVRSVSTRSVTRTRTRIRG